MGISEKTKKSIRDKLEILYDNKADKTYQEIIKLIGNIKLKKRKFSEEDSILVLYGDQIKNEKEKGLKTLSKVSKEYFHNFSYLHILPFFLSSGDRGFAVADYGKVDKKLGSWKDIHRIGKDFNLMFDLVLNHISEKHKWFKSFLKNGRYKDYFISFDKKPEGLDKVFRPRDFPLLSDFIVSGRKKLVWTTFGKDHIDLNYKNPEVFLSMIKILMLYVRKNVKMIRLDSAAFVWKELKTKSIHLKKTHVIIGLLREILEIKGVKIITETNVPFRENISYFSDGVDLVYNFSLPPLVLYSFYNKDIRKLNKYVRKMKDKIFLNFLDSHDGIGLLGADGLLTKKEIEKIIQNVKKKGDVVNYEDTDGKEKPYEISTTWFGALKENRFNIERYLASRAIALSLKGVPLIYFHGLFGSRNDFKGYKKSGISRDLNRANINKKILDKKLNDETSETHKIFSGINKMLNIRKKETAFNPNGKQEVLSLNRKVFSLIRRNKSEEILVLINIGDTNEKIKIPGKFINTKDLIRGRTIGDNNLILAPYEILWLK